ASCDYQGLEFSRYCSEIRASKSEFNDRIRVEWDEIPQSEKYNLYRTSQYGGFYNSMRPIYEGTDLFYDDFDIKKDTIYSYNIRGYNEQYGLTKFSCRSDEGYYCSDGYKLYKNIAGYCYSKKLSVNNNNLIAIDRNNKTVIKYSKEGEVISEFKDDPSDDFNIVTPECCVIDKYGNYFIVDSGQNRIQKYDSTGKYLSYTNFLNVDLGFLSAPSSIVVDSSSDDVFVTDRGNHRIVKYDKDLNFIKKWGVCGSNEGQFYSPDDIEISNGNIIVSDTKNYRLQIHNVDGRFQKIYEGFRSPLGLFVDNNGFIYVVDDDYIRRYNPDFTYRSLMFIDWKSVSDIAVIEDYLYVLYKQSSIKIYKIN
ncbi:MAG: NHL repeat-containing protein, partial [Spirochaetes bacterium]|nr:NHL repeat-containing protein [Spirochaetota bacterium]